MTHKFKVGDRVKYVNTHEEQWDGDTGIVTECKLNGMYYVNFDKGSACLAKYPNVHTCAESTLELIPMQDKVLIKPEDYHTLKKDDEVEITIKGTVSDHGYPSPSELIIKTNDTLGKHAINLKRNMEVYKLTPKATKLEVGEVYYYPNDQYNNWTVVHIDKINKRLGVHVKSSDNLAWHNYRVQSEYYRKSGIPIDWEATFS